MITGLTLNGTITRMEGLCIGCGTWNKSNVKESQRNGRSGECVPNNYALFNHDKKNHPLLHDACLYVHFIYVFSILYQNLLKFFKNCQNLLKFFKNYQNLLKFFKIF